MRKQLLSAVSIIALVVALIPVGKAQALPTHVTYYTMTYTCMVSPFHGMVVGQWTRHCDGSWTGWGESPYGPCTETEAVEGESCGIEPPLEP